MTRDEYEQKYSEQTNMTTSRLHAIGMIAIPCTCNMIWCEGWQMRYALSIPEDEILAMSEPYKSEVKALRQRLMSEKGRGKL
jgi:hypothetical protein